MNVGYSWPDPFYIQCMDLCNDERVPWNICSNLMSFSKLDGPHTGKNIGGTLLAEISEMVSLTKVSLILIFIFYYSIVMTSVTR